MFWAVPLILYTVAGTVFNCPESQAESMISGYRIRIREKSIDSRGTHPLYKVGKCDCTARMSKRTASQTRPETYPRWKQKPFFACLQLLCRNPLSEFSFTARLPILCTATELNHTLGCTLLALHIGTRDTPGTLAQDNDLLSCQNRTESDGRKVLHIFRIKNYLHKLNSQFSRKNNTWYFSW